MQVNGSVSALLEVGAGFHPELTGRENIRLNATILGFTNREIDRFMDQIIEFADIGEHIDAPLKHYSSGMYVRLGFAVAVMVRPEILIVDEVIAVGDEEFQRKCYDYLYDLGGRDQPDRRLARAGPDQRPVRRGPVAGPGAPADARPVGEVTKAYVDSVNAKRRRAQTSVTGISESTHCTGEAPGRLRVTAWSSSTPMGLPRPRVHRRPLGIRYVLRPPQPSRCDISLSATNAEGFRSLVLGSSDDSPWVVPSAPVR